MNKWMIAVLWWGLGTVVFAQGSDIPPKTRTVESPVFLMDITLDAKTGEETHREFRAGPFETMQECSEIQSRTGIQRPKIDPKGGKTTITVVECVLSHIDQET